MLGGTNDANWVRDCSECVQSCLAQVEKCSIEQENLHDVLPCKPVSEEELIDTSV